MGTLRRYYHREYMEVRRLVEVRCLTSPFKDCIPRCVYNEPVFYFEGYKAHTFGHLHNIVAMRKFKEDGLCVWHREGIIVCNDSGHYPGICPCHKTFYY